MTRLQAALIFRQPLRWREQSKPSEGKHCWALWRIVVRTAYGSGLSPICIWILNSKATIPETIGVAKLVPLLVMTPPSSTASSNFLPNARISLFRYVSPQLLKLAATPGHPLPLLPGLRKWQLEHEGIDLHHFPQLQRLKHRFRRREIRLCQVAGEVHQRKPVHHHLCL